MNKLLLYLSVVFVTSWTAAAQPVITNSNAWGIVNTASLANQGLPNSAIAQGSLFTIFGTGLGPTPGVAASSYPLTTSLAGVSVSILSQTAAPPVAALLLYVSDSQINAIMPSSAPTAPSSVTVTFNGQTSSTACPAQPKCSMIQVVPASVGIFSMNQTGGGQGAFTDRNGRSISYTSPALPGQKVNMWGTGLGAVDDDSDRATPGNIGPDSLTVYVGGVEVPALYHGRSACCSGLDQIKFQVPPGVTGCSVPVAVQIGEGPVSNFVSIAIAAASGEACGDPNGITGFDLADSESKGTVSIGYVNLTRADSFNPLDIIDNGSANFAKIPYSGFSLTQLPLQILNFGACSVYTYGTSYPTNPFPGLGLNAGPAVMISGPNGKQQLPATSLGNYSAQLGGPRSNPLPPLPLYLAPGSYSITGSGGSDVGSFNVAIQMPSPLSVQTVTPLGSYGQPLYFDYDFSVATRADGLTVTWTGADPNDFVIINGTSWNGGAPVAAGFNCTAKGSDEQFTVPPVVLLDLPVSGVFDEDGGYHALGSLNVSTVTAPVRFSAESLDLGIATTSVIAAGQYSIMYQ